MRGTVLSFSIQTNQGFISGDDGKRYNFVGSDWNLNNSPTQGARVDFDIDGNHAVSIYEDPSATVSTQTIKSRTTTAILALLLGGFGVHFFYLGAWGWGLVSVLFSWTSIPAIAGLILGIRYLLITDKEFEEKIKKMDSPFGRIEL
jgi:TM2 domain-containing membrane protein YozV/cold shock CspA family protein